MTFYNWNDPTNVAYGHTAKAWDAEGNEITPDIEHLDTETGECTILVKNEHGVLQLEGNEIKRRSFKVPAPIKVVFNNFK